MLSGSTWPSSTRSKDVSDRWSIRTQFEEGAHISFSKFREHDRTTIEMTTLLLPTQEVTRSLAIVPPIDRALPKILPVKEAL